jgi:hypothetical protein
MAEKPYTREQRAAVRQINAELGVGRPFGARFLSIGALIAIALAGLAAVCWTPVKPVEQVYGRVESVGMRGRARVELAGEYGTVLVSIIELCTRGDRIALTRRTTLLGVRYRLARTGCARVP